MANFHKGSIANFHLRSLTNSELQLGAEKLVVTPSPSLTEDHYWGIEKTAETLVSGSAEVVRLETIEASHTSAPRYLRLHEAES